MPVPKVISKMRVWVVGTILVFAGFYFFSELIVAAFDVTMVRHLFCVKYPGIYITNIILDIAVFTLYCVFARQVISLTNTGILKKAFGSYNTGYALAAVFILCGGNYIWDALGFFTATAYIATVIDKIILVPIMAILAYGSIRAVERLPEIFKAQELEKNYKDALSKIDKIYEKIDSSPVSNQELALNFFFNSPYIMGIFNPEKKSFEMVNDRFRQALGYTEKQWQTMDINDFVVPEEREAVNQAIEESKKGRAYKGEYVVTYRHADGHRIKLGWLGTQSNGLSYTVARIIEDE